MLILFAGAMYFHDFGGGYVIFFVGFVEDTERRMLENSPVEVLTPEKVRSMIFQSKPRSLKSRRDINGIEEHEKWNMSLSVSYSYLMKSSYWLDLLRIMAKIIHAFPFLNVNEGGRLGRNAASS